MQNDLSSPQMSEEPSLYQEYAICRDFAFSSNPSPYQAHDSTRYGGEKEAGKRTRTVVCGCIRCLCTYYLTSF